MSRRAIRIGRRTRRRSRQVMRASRRARCRACLAARPVDLRIRVQIRAWKSAGTHQVGGRARYAMRLMTNPSRASMARSAVAAERKPITVTR